MKKLMGSPIFWAIIAETCLLAGVVIGIIAKANGIVWGQDVFAGFATAGIMFPIICLFCRHMYELAKLLH